MAPVDGAGGARTRAPGTFEPWHGLEPLERRRRLGEKQFGLVRPPLRLEPLAVLELGEGEMHRKVELDAAGLRGAETGIDLRKLATRGIEPGSKPQRVRVEQRRHVAGVE